MPVNIESSWTWTEMFLAFEQIDPSKFVTEKKIASIYAFPNTMIAPPNFLSRSQSIVRQTPANFVVSVFVAPNPVVDALVSLFTKIYTSERLRLYVARTLEEAYALVAEKIAEQQ
jgi:hypothetical protein